VRVQLVSVAGHARHADGKLDRVDNALDNMRAEIGAQLADVMDLLKQRGEIPVTAQLPAAAPTAPPLAPPAAVKSVPWSDLEPTETVLGTGSFASVRVFKWLSRRMRVAVKELKGDIAGMLSRGDVAALKAEASLQVRCGCGACVLSSLGFLVPF
jgi:hypothetical protein